jgi:hypothetical protein
MALGLPPKEDPNTCYVGMADELRGDTFKA